MQSAQNDIIEEASFESSVIEKEVSRSNSGNEGLSS